jgi:hypothetical protein
MGANLNLRHINFICFLILVPFFARLASMFEKVLIRPKKMFFEKIKKGIKKRRISFSFQIRIKSFKKSGESTYFCQVC